MSVAIGMPMPAWLGVPPLRAKWISAGTAMPPTAATIGSSALRMVDNSPLWISRCSSRPISRKKIAISASLIHSSTERPASGRCQKCRYGAATGELASSRETMVQPISRMPPAFSDSTKRLKVLEMGWGRIFMGARDDKVQRGGPT